MCRMIDIRPGMEIRHLDVNTLQYDRDESNWLPDLNKRLEFFFQRKIITLCMLPTTLYWNNYTGKFDNHSKNFPYLILMFNFYL